MEESPRISFINACESAVEKGRDNLAHNWAVAFATLGGSALIASLWSIDDGSSSLFSNWFYKQLIDRKATLGEAMRSSRKHVLKNKESLRSTWAAFVLYGYPQNIF